MEGRRAKDLPISSVLLVIDDAEAAGTLEAWLELLDGDEPSVVDAGAADVLREFASTPSIAPDSG